MLEDALRAAEPRLQRVGQEEDAGDLAEAQGDDGQVVAAQAQHRGADQEAGDRRAQHDERQRQPERRSSPATGRAQRASAR